MTQQNHETLKADLIVIILFVVCTAILVVVQVRDHAELAKQLDTKTEEAERKAEVRERWRKMFEANTSLVKPINMFPEEQAK